jgi:hypothetical protein
LKGAASTLETGIAGSYADGCTGLARQVALLPMAERTIPSAFVVADLIFVLCRNHMRFL